MGKIVEFENVYIEYPDELELKEETEVMSADEIQEAKKEYKTMITTRTQRFSPEELQKKLEETQSLHL